VNDYFDDNDSNLLLVGSTLNPQVSGFTDIGNHRTQNQDAILVCENQALWVVADGMGGHSSGDKASQEIVYQLSSLVLEGDLLANIEQVKNVIHQVNDKIFAYAQQENTTCGSTVVILIQNQGQCAFLWAGDSRCYVRRNQHLYQLTTDHAIPDSHAITKAVGVYDQLDLECGFHELEEGDHFLLCTDGLYGTISEQEINDGLGLANPNDAQKDLKQRVLGTEARDNLSGIFLWF